MNLRRCPTCKQHLVRWGGRLLCGNGQCSGSPLEPDSRLYGNPNVDPLHAQLPANDSPPPRGTSANTPRRSYSCRRGLAQPTTERNA